jgi:hypothetical protein
MTRSHHILIPIVAFFTLLHSQAILAQQPLTENTLTLGEGTMPLAAIEDVAWLAGRWVGEGLGGSLEENWSPPGGRAMVGTFRIIIDNRPQFYEICLIAEERGTIVYKVKHFHPDLTGWEEKDDYLTFPLVKIEPDAVYFQGLTLKRDGDECKQYLAMRQKDGSFEERVLTYRRAP